MGPLTRETRCSKPRDRFCNELLAECDRFRGRCEKSRIPLPLIVPKLKVPRSGFWRSFSPFRALALWAPIFLIAPIFLSGCAIKRGDGERQSTDLINSLDTAGKQRIEATFSPTPLIANLERFTGESSAIIELFPFPAGEKEFVVSLDTAAKVLLHQVGAGAPQSYLITELSAVPDAAALSAVSSRLAIAANGKLQIFSLRTLTVEASTSEIQAAIKEMIFHPDGDSVLIAAGDGRIYRWRFGKIAGSQREREKVLERYIGHGVVVSALAYHPYERMFFSGDWKGVLSAWLAYDSDPFGGKYDRNIFPNSQFFTDETPRINRRNDGDGIEQLAVSGDGEGLLLGARSGRLELWSVRGLYKHSAVMTGSGLIHSMAISPDGKRCASIGRDHALKSWRLPDVAIKDVEDETKIELLDLDNSASWNSVVFVNNRTMVAGDDSGNLRAITIKD